MTMVLISMGLSNRIVEKFENCLLNKGQQGIIIKAVVTEIPSEKAMENHYVEKLKNLKYTKGKT